MAQHDQVIDNGPGLTVRTDINAAFAAIFSCSSGPVEPAVKVAGQLWFDTSTNPPTTRQRNGGNTAWTTLSGLSADGLSLFLKEGTVNRGSVIAAGGADPGTIALRAYNNSGVEVAAMWLNSTTLGTNKANFVLSGNAHKFIYLQTQAGANQGILLYNWDSNALEFRVYDAGGTTVINDLVISRDRTGYSRSTLWTWNAGSVATDTDMRWRVSSTRVMRWYFSQNGDIFLQESDDNLASHFINVMSYSRSTNNTTFSNYVVSPGHLLTTGAGSNNGLFNGNGDAASLATTNVWLRSWNGIGFPSSLDGINRITFSTRDGNILTSGRVTANDFVSVGYIYTGNGSSYMNNEGNILFSGGMTAFGGSLWDALNAGRTTDVYNGSDAMNTNFPVGTPILGTGDGVRNTAYPVYLQTSNTVRYTAAAGGAQLAGTWRAHGVEDQSGTRQTLFQRTA